MTPPPDRPVVTSPEAASGRGSDRYRSRRVATLPAQVGDAQSRCSRPKHVKIPAYVQEINGSRWWAVLRTDQGDLFAEMKGTLPADREVGSLFTVHRTKRGHAYLYWPQGSRFTRNRIKRAKQYARKRVRELREAMEDAA